MANLLQNPQHVARIGYDGFDMSQLLKFSSSSAELLPVYYDLLQPGDKVSMHTIMKTRTQPLETAAMTHITERIEWFFVPLEQIYKPFGSWYYGIQDLHSSLFYSKSADEYAVAPISKEFPYIPSRSLQTIWNSGRAGGSALRNGTWFDGDAEAWRLIDCFLPFSATASRQERARSFTFPSNGNGQSFNKPVEMSPSELAEYTKNPGNIAISYGVNPMFFAAYQKIYYDYYRLSDREVNNATAYNLDNFYDTGIVDESILADLFKLRYRAWKRDFFTNTQISPLFGETALAALNQNSITAVNQWLTGLQSINTSNQNGVDNTTEPTQVMIPSSATLSPANIRTAFAVEKLLEITRRAGKHYDAQTLAHFGVDVPTGISGEVKFIGREESVIQIADVVSTADTASSDTGAALGQVGGKGYGLGNGNKCQYTAPCHGILMAIYSAEPAVDYSDYGLNKLQTLINRSDWFTPEYDDLGMQPLFKYQSFPSQEVEVGQNAIDNANIYGWQYRYSELKTKYNLVRGALADYGTMRTWAPSRKGLFGSTLKEFLINPTYLNSIFLINYNPNLGGLSEYETVYIRTIDEDGAVSETESYALNTNPTYGLGFQTLYSSDPFLHEFYFDVKKASKMSTYGMPSL